MDDLSMVECRGVLALMLGGGVGAEVYEYAVELYGLGKLGRVRGEALHRARQLMGLLRDSGFSCPEVSLMSGGRWKADDVRQYGVWSERPDLSRRDAALGVFAEFVSKGYKFDDVAGYIEAKKDLDAIDMTYDDAITVGRAVVMSQASVSKLVEFSKDLLGAKKTVKELRERMDLDAKLDGLGVTREMQEMFLDLSKLHGGVDNFYEVLLGHKSLQLAEREEEIVKKRVTSAKQEIEALKVSKESLRENNRKLSEILTDRNRELAEINSLYVAGWNIATMMLVSVLTKQWGGVKNFMEGINKYDSLKKIEAEIEAKKAELSPVKSPNGVAKEKPAPKVKTMKEMIEESGDSEIGSGNPRK